MVHCWVFHAAATLSDKFDTIQRQFLHSMGGSERDSLLRHNLASLKLRRCFAMLGFIFKCVRGFAPKRCCALFTRDTSEPVFDTRRSDRFHSLQVIDPVSFGRSVLLKRSIYGLIAV